MNISHLFRVLYQVGTIERLHMDRDEQEDDWFSHAKAFCEHHEHEEVLGEIKRLFRSFNERINKLATEADLQAMVTSINTNLSSVRDRLSAEIRALSDKITAGQASAITDADLAGLKTINDQLADPTFGEPAPPAAAPVTDPNTSF